MADKRIPLLLHACCGPCSLEPLRILREEGFEAKLILQVHDELIVEAPEAEAGRVRDLLRRCMEGVVTLSVPLRTDISIGGDWRACK